MIKVTLPTSNRWLNIYFNTIEAYEKRDLSLLKKWEIDKILKYSIGDFENYEIAFEERTDGQYFMLETDDEIKWIMISADFTYREGDSGSNNAYFMQYFPMIMKASYEYQTEKSKKLELFLKGVSHPRATNKGQIMYYRAVNTIGAKILNINELHRQGVNIQKEVQNVYRSIDDWKNERLFMQNRNTGNKSSYILENENNYIFYGKTFGANGRETIFFLVMLAELAKKEDKKIFLYEVNDNGSSSLESSTNEEDLIFRKMLESLGIIYYDNSVDYVENEDVTGVIKDEKDSRKQAEFMRNLFIKYNAERDEHGNILRDRTNSPIIIDARKKCYLCDCTIQRAIIASHIQRVCDINDLNIPFIEKRKKAVDADNGLWLCANHDKMFEYGLIYFMNNKLMFSPKLSEEQKAYIKTITTKHIITEQAFSDIKDLDEQDPNVCIEKIHYNNKMHAYLEEHRIRTQA